MAGPDHAAAATWQLTDRDGLRLATCDLLDEVPGLRHAFSTRRSTKPGEPPAGFDLGRDADAGEPYVGRRRSLCLAAGLGARLPWPVRQVHGDRLVPVGATPHAALPAPEADGVLVMRDGEGPWVAGVRTADCVPVLIADRRGGAAAAVHAGWRGVAAEIALRAVERMGRFGIAPSSLVVALGPSIGPCCYEVGPEVLEAVGRTLARGDGQRGGRSRLDLREALRRQLIQAGLAPEAVSASPWCTSCREDLFFSHRRDGSEAGRMMAVIAWEEGPRLTLPRP